MRQLRPGEFFGETNHVLTLQDLTLSETDYTLDHVDWHYHENPYLTFLLEGKIIETSKHHTYYCSAGTLLYHDWDDAHFNNKPKGHTRGFQIEINRNFLITYQEVSRRTLTGSKQLSDPQLTGLIYAIYREMKFDPTVALVSVPALMIRWMDRACLMQHEFSGTQPGWVSKLNDLLHDDPSANHSLGSLAEQLDIHPVHLCRAFPHYFHSSLGNYVRLLKIQRAMTLLPDSRQTLGSIAAASGFSDQSHFIRTFRKIYGLTPLAYRRLIR